MALTSFLTDLLTTGNITLTGRSGALDADDLHAAQAVLRSHHAEDARELPHTAPLFDAAAAVWAAAFLYHSIQLALLRELDETIVTDRLRDYPDTPTPAAIYAVDLSLRYLPDVLHLAKGLAPGDVLVARLHDTLRRWPFSGVGTGPAEPEAEAAVLAHSALRQAYIDRIIGTQDRDRAGQPHLRPLVQTALGGHAATLWPDFAAFILPTS